MKIRVEIQQIENGFVVDLFTDEGPLRFDKTVYVESWEAVVEIIEKWRSELLEEA